MRTHIVIPDEMIKEIDEFVGPRGRSEFFAAAAEAQLRRLRLVRAINKVAGSLKDADIPGWETPESSVAWVMRQREEADRERNVAIEFDEDGEWHGFSWTPRS
jgi:hypothetical protein